MADRPHRRYRGDGRRRGGGVPVLPPRPALRHLLWLVVLVKLLTPPIVYWPWTLPMHGPAAASPAAGSPPGRRFARSLSMRGRLETSARRPRTRRPGLRPRRLPPIHRRMSIRPHRAFSWDWLPAAAAWAWLAGGASSRCGTRFVSCAGDAGWRGLPAPEWLAEVVPRPGRFDGRAAAAAGRAARPPVADDLGLRCAAADLAARSGGSTVGGGPASGAAP